MSLLTNTPAPDVTSAPARRRHAPWVGHTVGAVVMAVVGLLLGALAGVLIGLAAGILLVGPEATWLMMLGGAGEGALAGVVIGSVTAVRATSATHPL
jgi:hypothetical protein